MGIGNAINKMRWEKWRAQQDKDREKTYFYCWGECNVVTGPYIDFSVEHYRSGQSDCQGGSGILENCCVSA